MERDQLIELITAEVLNVVREQGQEPVTTARQPASSPAAGPAPEAKPAARPALKRPLVVVCGNAAEPEAAVAFFKKYQTVHPNVRVVLSAAAERLFSGAKRQFAGFTLRTEDRDFDQQVDSYDSLVVMNTTVNMVAKLAALIADTPVTALVFRFLAAGRPVHLLVDGLEKWFFNAAVRLKVQSDLAHLRDYGVCVLECKDLHGEGAASVAGTSACQHNDAALCEACGQCASRAQDRVLSIVGAGADRLSAGLGVRTVGADIARLIDHTLLKADATDDMVRKLCEEARTWQFASVCVNPSKVRLAAELLRGSPVKVCTVIGFPLGATTAATKACETSDAIANGADEIDMVINVGALKAKDYRTVKEDIEAVRNACRGHILKVILETSLLTDDEKRQACILSKEAQADFVKTSTGFGSGGATLADVALMRATVGPTMGVKASGGVKDLEMARKMIQAGATRIGAGAGVSIVKGESSNAKY